MPPEYPFGRVVGRIVQVVQGLPGDGSEPVYTPVRGARIRFDPATDEERLRVLRASNPTSLLLQSFTCATDEDGYLINGAGERWQELPATVDPELGFSEWLWQCTITSPVGNPAPFRFTLPVYTIAGTERDITTVAHVPATPGRELAEWESTYLRAQGVIGLIDDAGQAIILDIQAEGAGMEARAVAAATAAAAASSTQAAASASAAANSATLAGTRADAAGTSAATAKTEADRATTAANSVGQQVAAKADKTYVDAQIQTQKDYTDSRTAIARTRRTKTAAQAINNATWTQVTWPVDGGTVGITGAETFTIPSAGQYLIVIELTFAIQGTTGQRVFRLRRGTSEVVAQTPQVTPVGTTYPVTMQLITTLQCAAGDVLVVDCYHSAGSGQTVNVGGAPEANFLSIDRIS